MTYPGASKEGGVLERTIKIKKLEKDYGKSSRNVYFDFGQSEPREETLDVLNKVEKLMTENPGISIRIVGHTDGIGTEQHNLDLSKRRALSIKSILERKGFDVSRVETEGLGAKFPLASNDDEINGRELNRRVEIVILGN
jgi:outer membrane protein OmpA-like peptidoglycan-associated protein